MEFIEFSKSVLKENGYRLTKPRLAVLQSLEKTKTPLNAYEIAETVRQAGQAIDTVTVYRILEVFDKLELTHKSARGYMPCQDFQCGQSEHCHHEFTCNKCNKSQEIHITDQNLINQINTQFKGILINSHYFIFSGLCKSCNE